jgi:hypothetical protein
MMTQHQNSIPKPMVPLQQQRTQWRSTNHPRARLSRQDAEKRTTSWDVHFVHVGGFVGWPPAKGLPLRTNMFRALHGVSGADATEFDYGIQFGRRHCWFILG